MQTDRIRVGNVGSCAHTFMFFVQQHLGEERVPSFYMTDDIQIYPGGQESAVREVTGRFISPSSSPFTLSVRATETSCLITRFSQEVGQSGASSEIHFIGTPANYRLVFGALAKCIAKAFPSQEAFLHGLAKNTEPYLDMGGCGGWG